MTRRTIASMSLPAVLAGALLLALQVLGKEATDERPSAQPTLRRGVTLGSELPAGSTRRYSIALAAGRYVRLEVGQHGIDAVLRLFDADGSLLVESDGVNGKQGPEWLSLIADRAGIYVLEVAAPAADVPGDPGRFTVSVVEEGEASERNRRRVAADWRAANGRRLYLDRRPESLAAAVVELGTAAAELRLAGDAGGEADSLYVLGATEFSLERYEAGMAPLARALSLAVSLEDPRREADTRWMLGWGHAALGEWRPAVDELAPALSLFRSLGDLAREVRTLNRLSGLYVQMGDRERALELAITSLRVARPMRDSRELCEALNSLGSINLWLGKPEPATRLFEEALDIAQRRGYLEVQGANFKSLGVALRMLGRLEQAREPLQRALDIARTRHNPHTEAEVLQQLAGTYEGTHPARRDFLERALAVARTSGNDFVEAACLTNLAHTRRVEGDLDQARALVEQAVAVRERQWDGAPTEGLQALYLADQYPTYELYLDVLLASYRTGADPGALTLAFSAAEGARARALRQELSRAALEVRGEAVGDLRERRPVELPANITMEAVQRDLLDDDTVLLEYALGPDRSHLFLVGRTAVEVVELPGRQTIEAAALELTEAVAARNRRIRFETSDERRRRVASEDARFARAASALSDLVLAPVAERLAGKRLAIANDGALHYVPFGALPEPRPLQARGAPPAPDQAQPPLAQAHEIVYLPSATALHDLRRQSRGRPPQPATLAVLADPVLRRDDARLPLAPRFGNLLASLGSDLRGASSAEPEPTSWPDLPHAREEAQAILDLVPSSQRLDALGFAASRATASGAELSRYRFVHFATHMQLDDQQPDRSGIVLSRFDRSGRSQNELLSLADIYRLRLPADLVVLSGCRTALGKELRGEGLIGLSRGFLFAGAPRVVVSLWDVQDRATSELMKRFYSRMLVDGSSPAAALRQAQAELAASEEWSAPYYWAGFVLVGDWR